MVTFTTHTAYGVELEFSGVARSLLAEAIRDAVPTRGRWPDNTSAESTARWVVKTDCSCGQEITSPRYHAGDVRGISEIADVAIAIRRATREQSVHPVNHRCGLHVHLEKPRNIRRPVQRGRCLSMVVWYFEPILLSLLPRSRNNNSYAHALRSTYQTYSNAARHVSHNGRYWGLNMRTPHHTIEIRYGAGTTSPLKLRSWLKLWHRLFQKAYLDIKHIPEEWLSEDPSTNLLVRYLGWHGNVSPVIARAVQWLYERPQELEVAQQQRQAAD